MLNIANKFSIFQSTLFSKNKNTVQACKEIKTYKYNIFEWSLTFAASVNENKIIEILMW